MGLKQGALLPCPFCGGEAALVSWQGGGHQIIAKHREPCFLEGDCTGTYGRAADAIIAWNKRVIT